MHTGSTHWFWLLLLQFVGGLLSVRRRSFQGHPPAFCSSRAKPSLFSFRFVIFASTPVGHRPRCIFAWASAHISRLNHHLNPAEHPALTISSSLTTSIRLPAELLSPFCAVSRGGKPVPGENRTPARVVVRQLPLFSRPPALVARQLPLVRCWAAQFCAAALLLGRHGAWAWSDSLQRIVWDRKLLLVWNLVRLSTRTATIPAP